MLVERDIAVMTRDGSPIVVDVFRPEGGEPVPVIASISPYGKDVHWPERYPLYELVGHHDHMVWETPDPEWWVPRGYALVRADTRGTGKSPGRLELYGTKDAEDFYDVIEWAAAQSWSARKVASSGISWLAMMGWRVAALQPPHLAAVVAWEGSADFYRECAYQGGLYANGFIEPWWENQIEPQRNSPDGDDWREVLPGHPLVNDYHKERITDLERVTVPLLSAGNWGALHLHLRGNIEGWRRAASKDKWLVVHTGTHSTPTTPTGLRSCSCVSWTGSSRVSRSGWTAWRACAWRSVTAARSPGVTPRTSPCRRPSGASSTSAAAGSAGRRGHSR